MNTFAVSQLSTLRWSMEQDASAYSAMGFEGIGLYRPKLDDFGIDRTIELLCESSLHVTSLSWAGGFTGSCGLGVDDSVRDAIKAVREAANLRADTLIVLAGGRNNHIRSHARRTLCDALREVSAAAESFDVHLSLEPIHPGCGDEWSFIHDLRTTLDIIEDVGSTHLGLALDTYHVGMDDDTIKWLPDLKPHLNLVQFGDGRHSPVGEMNRCLLGEGCVPLQRFYEALVEQGYQGPMEVELLGEDIENVSYEQVLQHAKLFFDRLSGSVSRS
ncbi:Inosose isomerase [Rubripirellula amarantea]|uniref:Inosose isomerase n=1 Tax=Rubripirellula amarantea TaxID=2527999 RepID=A0A5C5WPJ4_9BACT|nr:sugar phosphate isomerase/epimerase family protein [Rubripirellula amarantea]TWT52666.1 Inosose isomerase [Rubripirellula amarantea]